jgi:hypothetical protein
VEGERLDSTKDLKLTSGSGSPSPKVHCDDITFRATKLVLAVLPASGLKAATARGSRRRTAAAFIIVVVVKDRRIEQKIL